MSIEETPIKKKRIALVVGIDEYEDESIPKLNGAENNAKEIFRILTENGSFEQNNNYLLLGKLATRKNILSRISEIFRENNDCELALFYFSGHGFVDDRQDLIISTYDIVKKDSFLNGIRVNEIKEEIYSSKDKDNALLILDCCYSSVAKQGDVRGEINSKNIIAAQKMVIGDNKILTSQYGSGKITIASSKTMRELWEKNDCRHNENDISHTHGTFSFHLIEGLAGKAANEFGYITLSSLFRYIYDNMELEEIFYSITELSNIEKIWFTKAHKIIEQTKKNIIEDIDLIFRELDYIFPDFEYIKKISDKLMILKEIDSENPLIPNYETMLNDALQRFRIQLTEWIEYKLLNKIYSSKLYSVNTEFKIVIYDFLDNLAKLSSYNELYKLDKATLALLDVLSIEAKHNKTTLYASPVGIDEELQYLIDRLRTLTPTVYGSKGKSKYNSINTSSDNTVKFKKISTDTYNKNEKNSESFISYYNEKKSNLKQIERYPSAKFPDKVAVDDIIPLEVFIKSSRPSDISKNFTSINLKVDDKNQKEIPVEVFVKCNYDEFEIVGNFFATINVPVEVEDSKSVIFNIKPKNEGEHSIQILFLQQTTVVGEIQIKSFVTRTRNQEPLSTIDYKKEWKSEDYPTLENPIPGPDITTIYINEINSLQYDVLLIDSDVPYKMDSIKFQFNPETKFNKIFDEIENSNALSMTKVDKEIKDIGMSLYDELFPEKLKKLYWELRDNIKSVRVISNEPWIPWEIIKPWRQLENGVGEEDDFLCERYVFSRWIEKPDRNKNEVKNIKIIVPTDTNLDATIKERNWIKEFANQRNIKISFDSSYDQVINTLKTEKEIDILHFSTHGQYNKEDPVSSAIELEGKRQLQPSNLVGKAVSFGQSNPIVILNACQTGNQGFSLTGIQGWATKFLNAGASVFIGTLWSVNDETAFNFVKEFYNQLASGLTLGESVKNARNKCKQEGDTSWLAYQLYGHPNSIIKF